MSGSIYNNIKTPSWREVQNTSYKTSSSNNTSVCDLCQGFGCVNCSLNSNTPSKKRKLTDSNQISSQANQVHNQHNNNNTIDLTTPPALNTRSAVLKRFQSDNASSSENQNSTTPSQTPSKTRSDISPNKLNNSNNANMDIKNLIDLINEEHTASKKQQIAATKSSGATNDKGLLCPVCSKIIPTATNEATLNLHIDECLSMKLLEEENTVPKNAPKVEITMPVNQDDLFLQAWQQALVQPVKKPLPKSNYVVHHDDEDDEEHDWEEEEESYRSQLNEEEVEEQLGKVPCPYHGCGAYVASEEFGKHVLQNHKGGYQKHLCPLCAAATGYSVHKGTNLYRHVQEFHAFFMNTVPQVTTNKPQVKPQAKPQNIEFVEELLAKDLDCECCICFEQFETGNTVARLPCLCIFHKTCVVRWFEKEKRCPVHEEIPQS